jgi:excisionase family DNA binding protein
MPETITILPDRWMTTAEVSKAIRRSERTVQEMAKDGRLKSKPATKQSGQPHNARLYDPADVRRFLPEGPQSEPSPASIARREARRRKAIAVIPQTGTEVMLFKDMTEMFRDVVQKLLAENQAQREVEAKRAEGERERWEIERAERALREKAWLTPKECAKGWGLPSTTVRELAEQGKIAGVRVGKSWRIRRASLEAFAG